MSNVKIFSVIALTAVLAGAAYAGPGRGGGGGGGHGGGGHVAVAVERRTPWVVAADISAVVDTSAVAAVRISAVRHAWVVARVWAAAAAACISGGDLTSEAAATSGADLVSVLFITVADQRDRDLRHGPVSALSAPLPPMVTELAAIAPR